MSFLIGYFVIAAVVAVGFTVAVFVLDAQEDFKAPHVLLAGLCWPLAIAAAVGLAIRMAAGK